MSVKGTPELVSLSVDGREVSVPKGLGLVETAAAAGIEIPVFCYEPRLGPAVGACRMCLVEVEGMPKLQAGCTLTAQDGMVVRTALTSSQAAEGQNATLEFILVNHPLDCPVCDKGGECPLQDLTFRYGPGNTRMTFPKRTFEKPIPISPLIALDRERCILCYRCTRFSEGVAEDGQLVAENRGAQSIITTFEDEPYRAPFSGNVIELCPVGALTSTQYRFEARPWEIQNAPTVCGLCPVGCNVHATTREGKVKRILSRNHPEVDEGWLCDKGRSTFPALRAEDRVVDPMRRSGPRRLVAVGWEEAIDEAERLLRGAEGRIVTAISGTESVEVAFALGRLLRGGLGAHSAVLPEETSHALDAFRAPLSTIRDAEIVVVVGDDPVVERAPVVDLWLRAAGRAGAQVVTIAPHGDVSADPGTGVASCNALATESSELGQALRAADRAVLIWSGPGGQGGRHLAELAGELGFADKEGCAAFHLPATPNGRGVADAWAAAADGEESNPEPIGLLVVSGDEAAADPNVRALAADAEKVLAIGMYRLPLRGWTDLVLPGTGYLERDGTMVNLEGRLQRLRRAVIPPCPDELAWCSRLAERFGVELSPYASVVFGELSAVCYDGLEYGRVGEHAPLPPRAEPKAAEEPPRKEPKRARVTGKGLKLVAYRPLFSGPDVERVPELQFQRPGPEVEVSADDADRRGIATGDPVEVTANGSSITLRARVNKRLMKGAVRIPIDHAAGLADRVEVRKP
jgi:NADH-quinone oxidoreductase subunit G